jgi:hypothetical protein
MIQDRELLRPSLTAEQRSSAAIYSVRAGFLAAFFGGPVAAAMIAMANSHAGADSSYVDVERYLEAHKLV